MITSLTEMTSTPHFYEVKPRQDKSGVDLISNALPFAWKLLAMSADPKLTGQRTDCSDSPLTA
jgi:hypothetical protein